MDAQLSYIPGIVQVERKQTIEESFNAFHAANPQVYRQIVEIAFNLKRRGFKRAGMKMIFERLRWLYAIQTIGDDYKLNNNYTALYARKVMDDFPELEGFFHTRARRSE